MNKWINKCYINKICDFLDFWVSEEWAAFGFKHVCIVINNVLLQTINLLCHL